MAQLVVFMFQVLYHYATNPNTPFDVDEMTFLDSRNKTEDELEVMLAHLQKQFIVEFPDGKESHVSFRGLKLFP
jgi:methyltransferase-like protein